MGQHNEIKLKIFLLLNGAAVVAFFLALQIRVITHGSLCNKHGKEVYLKKFKYDLFEAYETTRRPNAK